MLEIPSPPPLPSSWLPLQAGRLGTASSPGVSGSPAALEYERRQVGEPPGWKAAGTWVCLPPIGPGNLGLRGLEIPSAFQAALELQAL